MFFLSLSTNILWLYIEVGYVNFLPDPFRLIITIILPYHNDITESQQIITLQKNGMSYRQIEFTAAYS
jgi:hypothetical protein